MNHQSNSATDEHPLRTPITTLTDAWTRASRTVQTRLIDAIRAALATASPPHSTKEEGVPSVDYSRSDWELDRTLNSPEDISVGDTVRFSKQFTEADIEAFADASGDTNRLHLQEEFATQTRFNTRIVHGTLVAGLISAALARLPGLTIYLSQDMEFLNPVHLNDRVTATVEIVEHLGDNQYRLSTTVTDDDTTYLTGEAVVLLDPNPPTTDD